MKSVFKFGIILGLICLVATGVLATVNAFTKTRIAQQAQKELQDSLKEVLRGAENFEPVEQENKILYYKGTGKENRLAGLAFTCKTKGYSSEIETLVGMLPDGSIAAIKILSQNETPGLGSRITEVQDDTTILDRLRGKKPPAGLRPWFQEQFSHKQLQDIDSVAAITGATISSKAVITAVKTKAQEIQKLLPHG